MKRMAEKAEIKNEGNFTNTSGRKTAIQSLRGHFDPLAISELTGHANPSSIQSYSHNSIQTQKEMFDKTGNTSKIFFNCSLQQYGHYRKCFHFESATVLRKFV